MRDSPGILLRVWTGAFVGAVAAEVIPEMLSDTPPAIIPGMFVMSALSACVPATVLTVGFACGFRWLRRRSSAALLFALSLVFAAASVGAPYLAPKWIDSMRGTEPVFAWSPLLGGLVISFLGRREPPSEFVPSATRSDLLRRRLALIEAALLVFPVLALWPFGFVLVLAEIHDRILETSIGVALMGTSLAALLALVRLLIRFYQSRAPALSMVPKSWWVASTAGACLVVMGGVGALLQSFGLSVPGLRLFGIGIFGLPALLPFVHLAIEARVARRMPRPASSSGGH